MEPCPGPSRSLPSGWRTDAENEEEFPVTIPIVTMTRVSQGILQVMAKRTVHKRLREIVQWLRPWGSETES